MLIFCYLKRVLPRSVGMSGMLVLGVALIGIGLSNVLSAETAPLADLTLTPLHSMMHYRQKIGMKASLTAHEPMTVCLFKQPLAQFDWDIKHMSHGPVLIDPLVINFLPTDPFAMGKNLRGYDRWVTLKAGQSYTFRLSLSQLDLATGQGFEPGEYQVKATFHLCDPNDIEHNTPLGNPDPAPVNTLPITTRLSARFLLTY